MLNLMLWGFGFTMNMMYKIASIMDKNFKKRLQERNINIVVKTMDGSTARTYSLQNGKISSVGSAYSDPDLCVSLSGLSDMVRILFPINPKSIAKNAVGLIKNNKLKIEFKVEPFMWFSGTLMQMLTVYTDRTKPKKFFFINA